uniref:Uncharacterized protein n=1 Tax=Romanomermis culicivorax TaxID=13658 RepID=A0A915JDZ1_ROMCU
MDERCGMLSKSVPIVTMPQSTKLELPKLPFITVDWNPKPTLQPRPDTKLLAGDPPRIIKI